MMIPQQKKQMPACAKIDNRSPSSFSMRIWKRTIAIFFIFLVVMPSSLRAQGKADPSFERMYSLAQILALALEHNPAIAAGEGFIHEQKGQHIATLSYPNPTFRFEGGNGVVLDPASGVALTERFVSLSQPLEWLGTRSARQNAAEAGVQGAKIALEESRVNLTAEVKLAFYRLLLANRITELTAHNLETVQHVGRAVQSRVESGEAPPFEKIKIQVEILKLRKELSQAQGFIQSTKAALNTLTGEQLQHHFSVQGTFLTFPEGLTAERLSRVALKRNPTILKLMKAVEEASHRHIQQRQSRIPDMVVNGMYARNAGAEEVLGGVSIPIPIWSQRQGEIAQAMGTLRYSQAILLKTQQNVVKEVIQFHQQAEIADAQIQTFQKGLLREAQEALRIAQVSFRFGEASLLEVLDAQRVLGQTLSAYAEAQFELSRAITQLERLSGKEV